MDERWIDSIDGYLISNTGKIKNKITGHISIGGNIKKYKALRKKGKSVYYIHRLVAKAFIPNPENKPEVNHKDGNGGNNNYLNLEWVTHAENVEHAKINGLSNARGSNRFLRYEAIEINKMYHIYGISWTILAKLYNRNRWSIRAVTEQKHLHAEAFTL